MKKTKDEQQAREKLMEVTTQLIRERGNIEEVTIRDIAAQAGVGVGLVNYHFQTKENLVNLCIQRIIGQIIGQFDPLYRSLSGSPMDKLRLLIKENVAFLVNQPGLSRASITSNLLAGSAHDNTMQTMEAYRPVLREVCGEKATEKEINILLHVLISSMQAMFLRRETVKETMGIDITDKAERDELADTVLDHLFNKYM